MSQRGAGTTDIFHFAPNYGRILGNTLPPHRVETRFIASPRPSKKLTYKLIIMKPRLILFLFLLVLALGTFAWAFFQLYKICEK